MSNQTETTQTSKKRQLQGVVVSDKMDKTCVVEVSRITKHRKYLKHYKVSKRFKAHDPENAYKEGDEVIIEESRPRSKEKRWIVIGEIGKQSRAQRAKQNAQR